MYKAVTKSYDIHFLNMDKYFLESGYSCGFFLKFSFVLFLSKNSQGWGENMFV